MNSQPEPENFDRLQKLLALKRHEQPPPGYFSGLSNRIMQQIDQERADERLPWYRRLAVGFEWKPAFVWVTGTAACGLVCAGVIAALQVNNHAVAAAADTEQQVAAVEPGMPPMAAAEAQGIQNSMEPVLTTASGPSPFDQITIKAQRVNYTPGY